MFQEDDFLQGIRDGGLSPEAAESFPFLVGLANRLRETPVDPPTSPEPAAAGASDVTDPSIEQSAPKKPRTCLREVHNFMVGLEDPECEGRPPPPATTMDIETNGQHDDTVSTAGGAETVPMVVVDANGVQHATTMSCTDDPVAVMMQYVEKHRTFVTYLPKYFEEYHRVRSGKFSPEKVWHGGFEPSELVKLCKGAERGGHGFVNELFSMGEVRTWGEKRQYVVYAVSSLIVFENSVALDAFREEFKRRRPMDAFLFDEALPYNIEGYEGYTYIRIFGIGEGWDGARASHYRYFPKDYPETPLTTSQETRLRSYLIKTAHWVAEITEGVHWRTCPLTKKELVEVRTLKSYGTEQHKMVGLALEAVLIIAVQVLSHGIAPFNKQIGCDQMYMFHPVYQFADKQTSVGGEAFTYRGGCYSRVNVVADDYFSEGEDELEVCIEDPDFTLRHEPQLMEMLVFAFGDLPVTHEAIEAIVDASDGLPYRFETIEYVSEVIEDARQTMGETEAPYDLFVDPERLARVRIAMGLRPYESYTAILSDEAKPLRDSLVAADVLVEDYSMSELENVAAEHRRLVSEANPPEFVKAAGLTEGEAVRADEVLALVRRRDPARWGGVDRFLAELVSRWVASDKKKGLLEDARMLAEARHAAGVFPFYYDWLLGDGDLALEVRAILDGLDLFCGKPADANDINDAYVDIKRDASPSLLAEAMGVNQEAVDGVRVAIKDAGWPWVGVEGLECVLVELVKRCPKPCEEGLLASAPRLVEARDACPRFKEVRWLKALLEPHHDDGIAVRSAMEEAGLFRDMASLKSYNDYSGAHNTWTYAACVAADFEADKCAVTVADVRLKVFSVKSVQWSYVDPIVAAAIPLAKEEGGHLFKAKILAEAIKSLKKPEASKFYKFLGLLNKKDPTAVAVRETFEDAGMDNSKAYTLATETAVKELVKPGSTTAKKPAFYLAAQEAGFKDMDLESAEKVLEHYKTMTGQSSAITFDTFLANLVRLADEARADKTRPLELFASAENIAEASKGTRPSETFAPYLRGSDYLDFMSDDLGSAFSKFEAAYSETNAWKKLPRRGRNWRQKRKSQLTKEATAASEIQKLLLALRLERAGSTRATWAAAYDARYPPATDNS